MHTFKAVIASAPFFQETHRTTHSFQIDMQ
jgi:hypothetical protein